MSDMSDEKFLGRLAGDGFESPCTVPDILRQLPTEAHRAGLAAAMARPVSEVPTSRIERAIRDEKIPVSRPKLDAHRRGDCSCPRP